MKKIPLSQGLYATVDDIDYARVAKYKWHINYVKEGSAYGYAVRKIRIKNDLRKGKQSSIYMHRFILRLSGSPQKVDHINHDPLDNRKENLRVCTNQQNQYNSRKQINNTSGFKGVCFDKSKYRARRPWKAAVGFNGKLKYIGHYSSPSDAARAYNEAAIRYYGEFVSLNKI